MQPHDLGDLLAHGQQRVQAAHRLLEDHADLVAANRPHRGSDNSSRSRPRNRTTPSAIVPDGVGIRRMMDSEVTDLPLPDCPTIARSRPPRL